VCNTKTSGTTPTTLRYDLLIIDKEPKEFRLLGSDGSDNGPFKSVAESLKWIRRSRK
jgi:hypothetical protein